LGKAPAGIIEIADEFNSAMIESNNVGKSSID
jgi:hypothetical protein